MSETLYGNNKVRIEGYVGTDSYENIDDALEGMRGGERVVANF